MSMWKRKAVSFALAVLSAICLFACGKADGTKKDIGKLVCTLVSVEERAVVISVSETDGKCTVLDCMEKLSASADGFSYEISGGMVVSVNGKQNSTADKNYWFLYTSDKDMANTAWGTYEYQNEVLGSTVVGAESLKVVAGEVYVWAYTHSNY